MSPLSHALLTGYCARSAFLCHINDLPQSYIISLIVYCTDPFPRDQLLLQQDLAALEMWTKDRCMRLNVSKCSLMSLCSCRHPHSCHYKLGSHILGQVEGNPYIGVTIHHNLMWASDINKIYHRANSVLWFIKRNLKHAMI